MAQMTSITYPLLSEDLRADTLLLISASSVKSPGKSSSSMVVTSISFLLHTLRIIRRLSATICRRISVCCCGITRLLRAPSVEVPPVFVHFSELFDEYSFEITVVIWYSIGTSYRQGYFPTSASLILQGTYSPMCLRTLHLTTPVCRACTRTRCCDPVPHLLTVDMPALSSNAVSRKHSWKFLYHRA